jgi:hypothetical protein
MYGVTLNKRPHFAHRIAWAILQRRCKDVIDHVNGIRTDNRIRNLVQSTPSTNSRNQKKRATNTSGYMGVCREAITENIEALFKTAGKGCGLVVSTP